MRKLAITAFSFSAAIFLANYLLPLNTLWWLAAGFAGMGILLLLPRRKWLRGFVLCAFGLAVGFLCFGIHAMHTLIPAQTLDGETREITAKLLEEPRIDEEYSRVEVRLLTENLPKVNTILYAGPEDLINARPGDMVEGSVKLSRADTRYGERYDVYLSRDLYLIASAKSGLRVEKRGFDWTLLPLMVNRKIAERIERIFPEDTSGFLKSLMLGDKSDLYQDLGLHLAMSRAGFLHIVAVSGMHIAFLVGMIQLLFGRTARSALSCLVLVWFFVLVTGAPPSAVRAAVMQSFLLLAPLLNRENDPPTALTSALALILLVNPFAAASVSLQLSFGAMAGILWLGQPLAETMEEALPAHWAERLRGPIATAAGSLAVMAFTSPLTALHFGTIPILSPLTNILGLWAVSLCFCGGYLSCLLSLVYLPLGEIAAWITAWLARYLGLLSRLVSRIPFAVVYMKGILPVLWIVLVYAVFVFAFGSKLSPGKKLLIPLLLAAAALSLMQGVTKASYHSGQGVISAVDVGQGQCLAVMSGDNTMVIDCGSIFSPDNAGERAGEYLLSCGRKSVDVLMLTHLHSDHCNGVPMLMEMLPVKRLILQENPMDEDEMLDKILAAAERNGTEILWLQEDTDLSLGGISARLFRPGETGDANERCITAVVSLGDYDMLVTGDSSKTAERELLEKHPLRELELLIVGHHGSRYASSGELLGTVGADTAIISVGYNNFGHPTKETLERLAAYGYNIYRTDLNGTVEIRVA